MKRALCGLCFVYAFAIAACSGGGGGGGSVLTAPNGPQGTPTPLPTSTPGQKIQHVVIVVQENRSFDTLFATYPGADGTTQAILHTGQPFTLMKKPLVVSNDINHMRSGYLTEYDGGKMDGFDEIGFGATGNQGPAGTYPLRYVDPAQIRQYWTIAKDYELADHMFQTQGSGSFTGHQDLIAGGTAISSVDTIVDSPSRGPWGCDAPNHPPSDTTVTSYIDQQGNYYFNEGPFPCFTYKTLADLLDAKNLTWKYYVPPMFQQNSSGFLWTAYDAIHQIRYGPYWKDVVSPETNVFNDIQAGTLPAVSWVVPCGYNSDHADTYDHGPSWVASIINAIGKTPAWNNTAIIVVWDDWGGWYDHVPPPFIDTMGGLGFRVPMMVVSPYGVKAGYISHTQYEFGSILRFIEDNWNLGRLGTTDVRATSMADMFDLTQSPHAFTPIPSPKYQTCPSGDPPDTE